MWFQGPLVPANLDVEDDRLQSDDDDVASDENIVSGSVSDDDWTFIVGGVLWLEKIFYAMNFARFYVC